MKSKITGSTLPVLEVGLEPGDKIVAEPGEFSWMTSNVQLNTTAMTAGVKGVWGVLGRALSGGGIFMTEYSVASVNGLIAFTPKYRARSCKSTSTRTRISDPPSWISLRDRRRAAYDGISAITRRGDFRRQRVRAAKACRHRATAWIELGGETRDYDLQPNETIQVHPGHIGMFESTVNFDITFMKGIMNAVFGGDGLFIARLTGPGKVWLQTLTMPNLAHALMPYLGKETAAPAQAAIGGGIAGGIAGSLLKDMFGGS